MENDFCRSTGKLLESAREISTRARKNVARSILENNSRESIYYSAGWVTFSLWISKRDELRKSFQTILSCVINFDETNLSHWITMIRMMFELNFFLLTIKVRMIIKPIKEEK